MTTDYTEQLEANFVSLVKQSWKTHKIYSWNNSVDEILIGAVINANLEKGYLLIDLKSERPYTYNPDVASDPSAQGFRSPINSHFLRFEDPNDNSRVLYELDRITSSLTDSKVLGQLAKITIGYGQKATNFNQVMSILKQEFKSSFVDTSEPGIITFDAEELAGYVYAKVTIIINIADYYVDNDITKIDYEKLNYNIESVLHSLQKYLKGRGVV